MAFKTPQETAAAAVKTGTTKAKLSWDKALVGGFLAGAYIAFGGLVAIAVSSGLKPETWGTLPTLFAGSVFALGLVLVVLAGSELLTGNMALVPIAMMKGRVGLRALGANFTVVLIGNLIGSLFVAYFLAVQTGVIGVNGVDPSSPAGMTFERLKSIAVLKGDTEGADQIFLRALGCNWLVCLAVWVAMTAEDTGGKILGIFFPIMAFVAIGFDHVVANMFFLPAAIFAEVPGITWGDALYNWAFAFLGNLAGAAIFVSTAYWFLYLRDDKDDVGPTDAEPETAQAGNGATDGRAADGRKAETPGAVSTR
jgi:formate/nitrite transporter